MKREIKFRIYLQHEDTGRITSLIFDYAEIFSGKASRKINSPDFRRWYIIKKAEYTGLKDKNGREIYEGDIIKTDDPNWGYGGKYDKEHDSYLYNEISFEDGCFCIKGGLELYNFKYCEVIGNIYENPELLK